MCVSRKRRRRFCARTILEHGCDPNTPNAAGLTAIQLVIQALVRAVKSEQEAWVEKLRDEVAALAEQAIEDAEANRDKARARAGVLKDRKRDQFLASLENVDTEPTGPQRGGKKKKPNARQAEVEAALMIQRHFRGRWARAEVQDFRVHRATSIMQRHRRGASCRKLLEEQHPGHLAKLRLVRVEMRMKRKRKMERDFGESVLDIVRCLLNYRLNLNVEDTDYNTLLHLAAETGDTYGPALIRMLLKNKAPSNRKNRHGLTAFELAVTLDHAACALALMPPPPKLNAQEHLDRKKGFYETPPTEYHVLSLSPFMKNLGDLLYCRKWPADYRALLEEEQPQRAEEPLPDFPPVSHRSTPDNNPA